MERSVNSPTRSRNLRLVVECSATLVDVIKSLNTSPEFGEKNLFCNPLSYSELAVHVSGQWTEV